MLRVPSLHAQALKKFGKDDPDRWEHVAGCVPGKGRGACQRRFKELRESFKAKKGGA
jgi:DnaJ family protein C protein 2